MSKDKSTGKKLADMMYGNPEGAAFGIYPKAGKRSEDKQDREAAKNFPVDLARGLTAGFLGMPADILNFPGAIYSAVTDKDSYKIPYGSEDILKSLPLGSDTPTGQFASGLGTLIGGSANIGPAVRGAKALPGALKTAARNVSTPRTLDPQAGVIKMKGGNWLNSGSIERALEGLKRKVSSENLGNYTPEQIEQLTASGRLVANDALNKWVDRNLTNYIKKEMATPEDPVRKLAEEGVVHISPGQVGRNRYKAPKVRAVESGEALGVSDEARAWEDSTDVAISPITIKSLHPDYREPWMESASPSTRIYEPTNNFNVEALGFDHIIDVLREDLATGRIRPEQLNKVSMEQAVRRTYEYDQELAAKANAARAAQREGLPVYKEYPEGYRWVELNKPGAFASESEAMGHSVRGYEPPQGHPDWTEGSGDRGSLGYGHGGWEAIKSGKAKVYSLVDSKGEPHVTVEAAQHNPNLESLYAKQNLPELYAKYSANRNDYFNSWPEFLKREAPELLDAKDTKITQIKGKGNAAPKKDYLPFVQDFVKSGQWSDVGDIQNTGLMPLERALAPGDVERVKSLSDLPKYVTQQEADDLLYRYMRENPVGPKPADNWFEDLYGGTPPEGMARGGPVHFSDNPDVMQLEMAAGGIAKLAKLARAPAKTKEEISKIAERIAPQVTGEYVRKDAKSAKTVADKTQKQFQREKTLPVDVRPTVEERTPSPIDIEKLKGEVMIGIPGDPTLTGKTLYSVGDVKLGSPSPQHGGPQYGLYNDDAFWASGIGAARRVQNLAKEAGEQYDAPVLGKYIMMGPDSINYAQHFADANLQAIDLDRMTKRQVEQFNKLIRLGNPKSGPRPSFPGIEDKESAYLHMAMDPELRKHFNELMQKNTVTEALNLPSGNDIRFAITEPSLRDLETGVTGFSIGRMRPEISSKDLPLSTHPTYSHDIPGEFMGQSRFPIPYELSFPDTLKSIRENPAQAPHEFGSLKMVGPRQTIDQQMIDEIRAYEERMKALTGKKKGGAVRKAEGGEITADDLILEERKL